MDDIEKFLAATARLSGRYEELEVRSAAVRNKRGEWVLAGLFASPASSMTPGPTPADVDDARFDVHRIAAAELAELARSWTDGKGKVGETPVVFPRGSQPGSPPSMRYYREMQRTVDSMGVPDWSAETLTARTMTRGEFDDYGRHIDDQLRVAAVPWYGLEDVHRHFPRNDWLLTLMMDASGPRALPGAADSREHDRAR